MVWAAFTNRSVSSTGVIPVVGVTIPAAVSICADTYASASVVAAALAKLITAATSCSATLVVICPA